MVDFNYADIGIQPLPAGWIRKTVIADTSVNVNNSLGDFYDSYIVTTASKNGMSLPSLFKCSLSAVTECRQAILRLYMVECSAYGTKETLRLYMTYDDWNNLTYWNTSWRLPAYSYVDISTSSLGLVEIDVTSLVQNAIGVGYTQLSFAIEFADHREDTDVMFSFSSIEAPITFKPEIIINPVVPDPVLRTVLSDGDVCIDSAHPAPVLLPIPWSGADWYEYPIRYSNSTQSMYVHFNLSSINGTIKTATLKFSVMSRSSFGTLASFVFNVQSVSAPFDKDTAGFVYTSRPGYCSYHGTYHNPCGRTVQTFVNSFAYSDSDDPHTELSVDVTDILRYALYDGGILFLISSANSTVPEALAMIGGRWGEAPPYLEIEVETLPLLRPAEVIDHTIGNGYAVFHSVGDYSKPEDVIWNDYSDSYCSFVWKSVNMPEHRIGADDLISDGSHVMYYFNLSEMPDAMVYGYLENATVMIPVLGSSTDLLVRFIPQMEIQILKPDGTLADVYAGLGEDDYWGFEQANYREEEVIMRIPDHRSYISINVLKILRNANFVKTFIENGKKFVVVMYMWDRDLDSEWLRLGSTDGKCPAILQLRWDEYGHAYYVDGISGDDANDGVSGYSPWKHWDYAMNNVPNSGTLYYVGRENGSPYTTPAWMRVFDCEPEQNRIAPLKENVSLRPYSPIKYSIVEMNCGYSTTIKPYAEEQYVPEAFTQFVPVEGFLTMDFIRPSAYSTLNSEARYFFHLGTIQRPVAQAVLRVYVASLYNPENAGGGDHGSMQASRLTGGSIPGSTTAHMYYTEVVLGDFDRFIIRDYVSFDVTNAVNYVDPANGTDIVAFGLIVGSTPVNRFTVLTPSIDCTVVPDMFRTPTLYIAQTENDIIRNVDSVEV